MNMQKLLLKNKSLFSCNLAFGSRLTSFNKVPIRTFYFQEEGKHGPGDKQIVAKRVINCVGRRLREFDPHRWDSVPITFETVWEKEDIPFDNLRLCILVHDALEKEFNVEVDDKKILLKNVKDCVNFILESHHTAI